MMTSSIDVSVVIVNWNTKDLLQRCLESVYRTLPPLSFEVVLVDNASTDGSAEMVAELFPQVTLIVSDVNLGYSAGSNLGMASTSGEFILLMNPDTELQEGAVIRMVEFARAQPKAGIVGPRLLNPDGSLQKSGRTFTTWWREVLGLTKLYNMWVRLCPEADWGRESFDIPAMVDEVSGACMLVRRLALDEVGMLDERFFMYYEEVDWCRRMAQAGWEIHYLPSAEVVHHWSAGAKKAGLSMSHIAYRSQYLYFRKHHGLAQALLLRALSGLVLLGLHIKHGVHRRHPDS
ncbi:MAG: glycosyltransferase family 2 protein [Armatimonadota bacterium]